MEKIFLNALATVLDTNKLQLRDPDLPSAILEFRSQNVQYDSPGSYYWHGNLTTDPVIDYGDVTLISRNGERFGILRLDNRVFSILDIGGRNILINSSSTEEPGTLICEGGIAPPSGLLHDGDKKENIKEIPSSLNGSTASCRPSILVLYTPNALDGAGSLEEITNRAIMGVELTNQILIDSDVPSNDLRFELAGVELVNYDETGEDWEDALADIRSGAGNNAPALRNTFDADIVITLVHRPSLANNGGSVNGVAYVYPSSSFAYGLVTSNLTNETFTFSHEVGHIMGAAHEPCNVYNPGGNCCGGCIDLPPGQPINRGHSWFYTTGWWWWQQDRDRQTVMYSESSANPFISNEKVPRYSNPDVNWLGSPTGVAGQSDNADIIGGNGCRVAGFRVAPEAIGITFSGSHHGCGSQQLCVNIENDGAPVTWRWQFSYDGINFYNISTLPGNEQCITANFPNSGIFYYGVELKDNSGNVIDHSSFFVTGSGCLHPGSPEVNRFDNYPSGQDMVLQVAPNPIHHNKINLRLYIPEGKQGNARFRVWDLLGHSVQETTLGYLGHGQRQIEEALIGDMTSGSYMIEVTTDAGFHGTATFVVTK